MRDSACLAVCARAETEGKDNKVLETGIIFSLRRAIVSLLALAAYACTPAHSTVCSVPSGFRHSKGVKFALPNLL